MISMKNVASGAVSRSWESRLMETMEYEMREQKPEICCWMGHRLEQVSLHHRITAIRRHAVRNPKPNGSHSQHTYTHTHTHTKTNASAIQNVESVKRKLLRRMAWEVLHDTHSGTRETI